MKKWLSRKARTRTFSMTSTAKQSYSGRRGMPELCYAMACSKPASGEYHWYEEIVTSEGITVRVEVVWELCDECLTFAEEVVESVSELDNEEEREKWISG